jgi:hypothetical protein
MKTGICRSILLCIVNVPSLVCTEARSEAKRTGEYGGNNNMEPL